MFCPPNEPFLNIWVNHGISHCFMETISSAVLLSYTLIFFSLQHCIYVKYANPRGNKLPQSLLFKLQVVLIICLPLLSLIRLVTLAIVLNNNVLYGYLSNSFLCSFVYWIYSLSIVFVERWRSLPTIATHGHGLTILVFWALAFINENLSFVNLRSEDWWFLNLETTKDKAELCFFVLRYITTLLVFIIGMKAPGLSQEKLSLSQENLSLSQEDLSLSQEHLIGEIVENKTKSKGSSFRNMCSKIKLIMPMIWPKKNICLQLIIIICFLILVLEKVLEPLTPLFYKHIIDSLTHTSSRTELIYRWDLILIYMILWLLSGTGTLSSLLSFLWHKVEQYSNLKAQVSLFTHLHSLALRWHLSRKTGEVIKVVDRSVHSLDFFFNYIIFTLLPSIIAIIVAIVYLATAVSGWLGLILFISVLLFLGATIFMSEWETKLSRSMNELDNDAGTLAFDSLLNFGTVKYYSAESYEIKRYKETIIKYQAEVHKSYISRFVFTCTQNIILFCGLLAGMLLCARMVVDQSSVTVGDFVLLVSYTQMLYQPLYYFDSFYRHVQRAFVDMESMFDLLQEKPEVQDIPNASELIFSGGKIEFKNVSFAYKPEQPILKRLNLTIQPGRTLAIVGPTGSGKSTLTLLLFRLFDVTEGTILIDDQDISTVSQRSLRELIGVVPQDSTLFNADIRYNIRYGKVTASDEEVEAAAKAAEIHNAILNFPKGYDTVVGERGLKLSGGEKQRVAIARTILKQPSIILLDEATSALDTQTERNIQASLKRLCANKTTLIVAHRLSTVVHAHQICVLKEGEIIEIGSHEELLKLEGEYFQMWEAQQKENTIDDGSKDDDN